MKLKSKEEAEAFVKFLLGERIRHLKDIRQIESMLKRVSRKFDFNITFERNSFTIDGESYTLEDIWVGEEDL